MNTITTIIIATGGQPVLLPLPALHRLLQLRARLGKGQTGLIIISTNVCIVIIIIIIRILMIIIIISSSYMIGVCANGVTADVMLAD